MKDKFFSIIIPIYNKRFFLIKGLDFLLKQSFKNFEIIFIDDASYDGSSLICDEFVSKNKLINVIHQKNQGAGVARNVGIDKAKGNYVCFFDIDDKVNQDWLEKIYELIIFKNPDVLVYSYNEINPKLKTVETYKFQDKNYISNNDIKSNFVEKLSGIKFNNGFVWNKVYKRDFLIKYNIKFPDLRIQQDEVFNHIVYKHANSLMTSSEVLYDYYVYDSGNTRNTYIPDRLKIFEDVKHSFFNLVDHWQLENTDLEYYIHSRFVKNSLFNRNPKNIEKISTFRNILFQNESLNESVVYILKNSKRLSYLEKLYIKSIVNKSRSIFLFAEVYSQIHSLGRKVYHKILR